MVYIEKSDPPEELQKNIDNGIVYEDLLGSDKENIRKKLFEQQSYLCVYCMRSIDERDSGIEHWYPRNPEDGFEKKDTDLDYNNLYMSCKKEGATKYLRKYINQTCDMHKGNKVISIYPSNRSHIDTIYYDPNGEIHSTNPDFENDIVNTLNLNCVNSNIVAGRKLVIDAVDEFVYGDSSETLNKEIIIERCNKIVQNEGAFISKQYIGAVLFRAKELLNKYSV